MGLFNNLRHKIVRKFIRPEDGYIYIGRVYGEPIKFYYDKDADKYILGMRTSYGYHSVPTLAGWADGWVYSVDDLKEVKFEEWIHGILRNVSDEYSQRLDNLSQSMSEMAEEDEKNFSETP